MPEQPPPSIRQIAAACGFSRSTVGAALQNRADISQETRRKIHEVAARLGYRQDAEVQRLMSYLRGRRTRSNLIPIALLCADPEGPAAWRRRPWNQASWQGLQSQSTKLGFQVVTLGAGDYRERPAALRSVLIARGVRGVVLDGSVNESMVFEAGLDDGFSLAWLNAHPWRSAFHTSCIDHGHNMNLALEKVTQLGYRRPGLALLHTHAEVSDHMYESTFLGWQYREITVRERIPILTYPYTKTGTPPQFSEWVERHEPDVILGNDIALMRHATLCGRKVPEKVGLVHFNLADDVADWSGIRTGGDRIGQAAIDLVAAQFQRGESGRPAFARSLHVRGEWIDGRTTRKQSTGRRRTV